MAGTFTIPGLTMSPGSSLPANTSISFSGGTPIKTIPQNQQSVLGASTTSKNTGGGGSSNPQPNFSSSSISGQSASSPPDLGAQIDQAYSGEMNFLNTLPGQLQGLEGQAQGAVNQQYTGQQKSIADQLSQLQTQLGIDRGNFGNSMNNAYTGAQNSYNQLLQRNLAMYGNGSSAGPEIAALLGQGYQQQTGTLQSQGAQGAQQLDLQGNNITQWGDTQNNQLDTWHNQALNTIANQYQSAIDNVNQQVGMTEDAKANAKLGVLQNYIQQQSNLNNYRQQLSSYIQAYQNISPGQGGIGLNNFDPGNYAAMMQGLGQNVGMTAQQLQSQYTPQAQNQQVAAGAGFLPNFGQQNNNQLTPTTGFA